MNRQQQKSKLSQSEKTKLLAIKNSLPYFARNFLKIRTKAAKVVKLELNQSQRYMHDRCESMLKRAGKVRVIVVKGRQSGISTYVAARYYHKTTINEATNTFILSHDAGTTDKLFKMVKLYQEKNALAPPVKKSNARELDYDATNSSYYVGTAGSGDVGRGGTVQLFHGSEVGFWSNTDDIQTGLMQSIPDIAGTEIILESTANGLGNFFHRMTTDALKGKNGYEVVFIPWFWSDEYEADFEGEFYREPSEKEYAELYLRDYDDEQADRKLAWRRQKIAEFGSEWKFKQEYPATVQEAFQTSGASLIRPEAILKAREHRIIENFSHEVLGVDPARTGDRTALVFRKGREITQIVKFDEMDEMRLAGIVANYIEERGLIGVMIDCTNSWGVYDRLKELGYGRICHDIHFASKAIESDLYSNKRAEIWCKLRDWLHEGDVSIPDDDEFHVDLLCVPDYRETSDSKIRLESKEKIRKESGLSPDLGDAAALTFAVPVNPEWIKPSKAAGGGLRSSERRRERQGGISRKRAK